MHSRRVELFPRRSGARAILPVLFSVWLCAMASSCEGAGGPSLVVTAPTDGDWFTSANITATGTCQPMPVNLTFDADEFRNGTFNDTGLANGRVQFRPKMRFSDHFNDGNLDSDTWEILNDGVIGIQSGWLVLQTDEDQVSHPLIISKEDMFPQESDWSAQIEATFRVFHLNYSGYGFGISENDTHPLRSHTAVYSLENSSGLTQKDIFANGKWIDKWWGVAHVSWYARVLSLDYRTDQQLYTANRLGERPLSFESNERPTRFWIGHCPEMPIDHNDTYLCVNYVTVWTFSGYWTSQIYDLGGSIEILKANSRWSSSHYDDGLVEVLVRGSDDGDEWSRWVSLDKYSLDQPINGSLFQFGTRISLDDVREKDAWLRLDGIDITYVHPIEAVEYKTTGSEWIQVDGGEEWWANITLSEGDNRLSVKATDAAWNTNTSTMDLVMDTTPPHGMVSILPEGEYTNDPNITLSLMGFDEYGISRVHVSLNPSMTDSVAFEYAEAIPWHLGGNLGDTSVYVVFEDIHGLLSEVISESIYYDPYLPTGTLTIEDGEPHTDKSSVTLRFDHHDETGVAKVEVSNEPLFTYGVEMDLGIKQYDDWELARGPSGHRTVYMRVTDLAGNIFITSAGIDLFVPTAEGGLLINEGANQTGEVGVVLGIGPPEGMEVAFMQLSNEPTFDGIPWDEVRTQANWLLTEGDGTKHVFVRFQDPRGYWTLPVNDNIVLDTTPPEIGLVINDGDAYTTDADVMATPSYDDPHPPSMMWISLKDDIDGAVQLNYTGAVLWSLPDSEGVHTVRVWVSDVVGNIGYASDSIHLAKVSPFVSVTVVGGIHRKDHNSIEIQVQTIDQYGTDVRVRFGFDEGLDEVGSWHDPGGQLLVPVPPDTLDGHHNVTVRARNALGLLSEVVWTEIVLDRVIPDITVIDPVRDSVIVANEPVVSFKVDVMDENGVAEVMYRINDGEWVLLDPDDPLDQLYIGSFGEHDLDIIARDPAGNEAFLKTSFEVQEDMTQEMRTWGISIGVLLAIVGVAAYLWYKRRDAS